MSAEALARIDAALVILSNDHQDYATPSSGTYCTCGKKGCRVDQAILALREARDEIARLIPEPPTDDERETLALVIAKTMPGWNEDTTEPPHPGWSEALRLSSEQHWERINQECLRQGRIYADAIIAAGFRRRGPVTVAEVEAAWHAWVEATNGTAYRGLFAENSMRAALEAARDV